MRENVRVAQPGGVVLFNLGNGLLPKFNNIAIVNLSNRLLDKLSFIFFTPYPLLYHKTSATVHPQAINSAGSYRPW